MNELSRSKCPRNLFAMNRNTKYNRVSMLYISFAATDDIPKFIQPVPKLKLKTKGSIFETPSTSQDAPLREHMYGLKLLEV